MAACETEHWTLDCGEGSGCYLVEYSDTGELAGWGCNSKPVKGRPKPRGDRSSYVDRSAAVEFCCHDIGRAQLAEALVDLVDFELVVPEETHGEKVSLCVKGTMEEVIRGSGLSMRG